MMVSGGTSPVDLGYLAQFTKPTISNLGIKTVSDLNLNSQVRAVMKSVVKSGFF